MHRVTLKYHAVAAWSWSSNPCALATIHHSEIQHSTPTDVYGFVNARFHQRSLSVACTATISPYVHGHRGGNLNCRSLSFISSCRMHRPYNSTNTLCVIFCSVHGWGHVRRIIGSQTGTGCKTSLRLKICSAIQP